MTHMDGRRIDRVLLTPKPDETAHTDSEEDDDE